MLQQLPRYVECVGPGGTTTQDHGQQFRIGQGLGSALEQPFARPLAARPLADVPGLPRDDKLLIHRAIMTVSGAGAEPPIGRVLPITGSDGRYGSRTECDWPDARGWG